MSAVPKVRLVVRWKDYENAPAPHLGMSWRSGRCKVTFPTTSAGRRSAETRMRKIEGAGRRWGRVAVIYREEQP